MRLQQLIVTALVFTAPMFSDPVKSPTTPADYSVNLSVQDGIGGSDKQNFFQQQAVNDYKPGEVTNSLPGPPYPVTNWNLEAYARGSNNPSVKADFSGGALNTSLSYSINSEVDYVMEVKPIVSAVNFLAFVDVSGVVMTTSAAAGSSVQGSATASMELPNNPLIGTLSASVGPDGQDSDFFLLPRIAFVPGVYPVIIKATVQGSLASSGDNPAAVAMDAWVDPTFTLTPESAQYFEISFSPNLVPSSAVPEPTTLSLCSLFLVGALALYKVKRRFRAAAHRHSVSTT